MLLQAMEYDGMGAKLQERLETLNKCLTVAFVFEVAAKVWYSLLQRESNLTNRILHLPRYLRIYILTIRQ